MSVRQLKATYQAVEDRLSRVNFENVWPGFVPVDFALYTQETMYFRGEMMPTPEGFIGNTSIEYEGAFIAIWNMIYTEITGEESLDQLAANLVHEMFHAFQRQQGETRFPIDLELLLYPHDEALVAWTRRELAILTDPLIYAVGSPAKTIGALREIAMIRCEKTRISGGATINEFRTETVEGLAEYAGLRGLLEINPGLAEDKVKGYRKLLSDGRYLFDIRRRCYYSGVLIALLSQAAGLTIAHDLSTKQPFWNLLDITAAPLEPLTTDELSQARLLATADYERREQLLACFNARFDQERPVDATIVGYDPMNLTRVGHYLISTHFLMIDDGKTQKPLMGDHLLRMKEDDPRQIVAIAFGSS